MYRAAALIPFDASYFYRPRRRIAELEKEMLGLRVEVGLDYYIGLIILTSYHEERMLKLFLTDI